MNPSAMTETDTARGPARAASAGKGLVAVACLCPGMTNFAAKPCFIDCISSQALTSILRDGRETANIRASSGCHPGNPTQMQFDDVILGRRSIRGYKPDPVPRALIRADTRMWPGTSKIVEMYQKIPRVLTLNLSALNRRKQSHYSKGPQLSGPLPRYIHNLHLELSIDREFYSLICSHTESEQGEEPGISYRQQQCQLAFIQVQF